MNTVRNWVKSGQLPAITAERPHLVQGRNLQDFRKERRSARRSLLRPGQMHCIRCKAARYPAEGMVEDIGSAGAPNLRGICPVFTTLMHRRVSAARLAEFRQILAANPGSENRAYSDQPDPA